MLEGGYLVSHGGVIPGFESQAMALAQRTQAFWERHERDGRVRRVGPFYLAPGGGNHDDIAFFTLYLGRLNALHEIVLSEEYERIFAVAMQVTRNFRTRVFGGGTPEEVGRILSVAADEWRRAGLMSDK